MSTREVSVVGGKLESRRCGGRHDRRFFLWPQRAMALHGARRVVAAALAFYFMALSSPINALADGLLFSAHMLQHMLLLLIVPLLIHPEFAAARKTALKSASTSWASIAFA